VVTRWRRGGAGETMRIEEEEDKTKKK